MSSKLLRPLRPLLFRARCCPVPHVDDSRGGFQVPQDGSLTGLASWSLNCASTKMPPTPTMCPPRYITQRHPMNSREVYPLTFIKIFPGSLSAQRCMCPNSLGRHGARWAGSRQGRFYSFHSSISGIIVTKGLSLNSQNAHTLKCRHKQ